MNQFWCQYIEGGCVMTHWLTPFLQSQCIHYYFSYCHCVYPCMTSANFISVSWFNENVDGTRSGFERPTLVSIDIIAISCKCFPTFALAKHHPFMREQHVEANSFTLWADWSPFILALHSETLSATSPTFIFLKIGAADMPLCSHSFSWCYLYLYWSWCFRAFVVDISLYYFFFLFLHLPFFCSCLHVPLALIFSLSCQASFKAVFIGV